MADRQWETIDQVEIAGHVLLTQRSQAAGAWIVRTLTIPPGIASTAPAERRARAHSLTRVPSGQLWDPVDWQTVDTLARGGLVLLVQRVKAPGGWLVRTITQTGMTNNPRLAASLAYVPDADGAWTIKEQR